MSLPGGAQADQLKLLRAAAEGTLPRIIEYGNPAFEILRELCEAGLMTATYFPAISTAERCFRDPQITLAGREYLARLEQLAVPDHAADPAADVSNSKHDARQMPRGISIYAIVEGAIAAVLAVYLLYLLATHFGLPGQVTS